MILKPLTYNSMLFGHGPHGMTIPDFGDAESGAAKDVCWSAFRVFDRMLGGSLCSRQVTSGKKLTLKG